MNGRRAVLKPLLVAACILTCVGAAAVAAAAPSAPSVGRPPAAAGNPGQPPATVQAAVPAGARYAPGQVLVKYKAGVTAAHARADAASSDATVTRQITGPAVPGGRLAVVHSDTLTTKQLIAQYQADPSVAYAEPDYVVHTCGTPNDARFDELWGMQQIYAPSAWNVSTGSSTVVVADLDTGVDYTHPDLYANLWHNPGEWSGTSGVDDDHNGYVDDYYGINAITGTNYIVDDNGHGTHTAGTMAAVGNNGIGVTGVCQAAKVMACKFLDANGNGYTSDAIECINYVTNEKTQHAVNVVAANCSFCGTTYSQSEYDAIVAAGTAGIVFVCAAGNDGVNNDTSPHYPASYTCSNIISVAATNGHDMLAWFSDYGASSVDLAAPGVDILSTVPSAVDSSRYASWQGTSMAAPQVTGAIALCAAVFPTDTWAQRRFRVLNTVDYSYGLAHECTTQGRLDVSRAVGNGLPGSTDIPGLAMPYTGIQSYLSATTGDEVRHLFLKVGAVLHASLTASAGVDFDLYLFGPHATTVGDKSAALASVTDGSYPIALTYTVPTTGTYYLDTCAVSGSSNTYLVCSTGIDEIPGIAIPPSPVYTGLDELSDNVYDVDLSYGQTLDASLRGPSGSNFLLYLFNADALTVWTSPKLASGSTGDYPHVLTYTSWESGGYYLDASTHSGIGVATLDWSITGPGDNDISGASSIPGSGYQGLISSTEDLDDVYSIQVPPAQTVNLSVSGDSGTEYDVYVFDAYATTVEGHQGAVVSSTGTTYPQTVSFTSPPSPFPFSRTYYVDVHAVTGEGAYTLTYSRLNDTAPPVTTATGLQALPTAWQNTAQDVTLTPSDSGGSGLAHTFYTVDGAQSTYADPFTVGDPGSHVITYWSTDNAGNEEAHHTGYVNIDTTAPVTEAGGLQETPESGWTNEKVAVTLTSTDEQSGIDATIFTVDGRKYVYEGPYTVSKPGSHEFTYWAVDLAGNEETHHVGYVNIDTQPPAVGEPTLSPAPSAAGWNDGDVVVTINAKDGGGAGVQKTQYAVHGSEEWRDANEDNQFTVPGPPDHSGDGAWAYDYIAFDNAGNHSDAGTVTVRIDTVSPELNLTMIGHGQWLRNWNRVSSAPTDEGAGVDARTLVYCVDGGPWTSGASVKVKTTRHGDHNNGVHTVDFQVADLAGNRNKDSRVLRLDSMPPKTTDDAPTTTVTAPITVTLTPVDAGCGVRSTWWTLGDGVWQSGTSVPLTPPSSGSLTETITYYSVDNLGTAEAFRSVSVTLAAP